MHNPHNLRNNIQENFGTVIMFAFGFPSVGTVIRENFDQDWAQLQSLILELPEKRADRALLEMAVQMRALDDLNGLNDFFQQQALPPLGWVVQDDASKTPLYFRDMTNKIMHSSGFSWELANPKNPCVVCLSGNSYRWKEAHIELVTLISYLGKLSS